MLQSMSMIVDKCFIMSNFADVMVKVSCSPSERSVINKSTIPVGEIFESHGVFLMCIERPYVSCPLEACSGCYFSVNNLTCPKSQCSRFGRTDERNVWFVEVTKE